MKASFTSRITCSVLAATLAALPCNEALAAPAPAPTSAPTASPPASTPPATGTAPTGSTTGSTTGAAKTGTAPTTGTTTPPATGTTTPPATGTTAPTTGTPTTGTPPTDDPNRGIDGTGAVTAPGETPTEVPGETPPEGETPPPAEPAVVAPPPPPPVPEGPERPPEPTVANGKYKAKGNGLMIAGGTLLGLGLAGVITSALLTRCTELEDSFACKNKQHNTFAVPATATAALLGAVLLFVGVGYKVRYKKWENWRPETAKKTAFGPTIIRGGAGVSYTLKF